MRIRRPLALALLSLVMASRAGAQDAPDAKAKVRFGPLAMSPTLALTNLGRDDNVFNRATGDNPASDFTMTITPATDLWLRMGRTWLSGNIREDLVYYQKFATERSANTSYRLGWLVPLNRLTFNVNGQYLKTRNRPDFEIDTRSQRVEKAGGGSIEIRALSKTFFGLRGEYRRVDFDKTAVFLATNLYDELNRKVTTGVFTIRHQLTPLTSLTFDVSREQSRFQFSSLRDSDSTKAAAGVKFEPFALISGTATVGYRDFKPLSAGVPGYRGLTSQVDIAYTALGSTKITLSGLRDVQYSFDVNQPYYIQTGATVSVSQQVYGPFDVVGRVGYQQLDYRDRAGAVVEVANRRDTVRLYGGGAGYRIGSDMRIGFDATEQRRSSKVDFRNYNGLRYGLTVTYGF